MPQLWRISNFADLAGLGGLQYSARWHSKGRPIVYAAEHPAGALTEFLAHINREDLPSRFQLLTIAMADNSTIETVVPASLQPGWIADHDLTRPIGDAWLGSMRSLALRVPSAIVPNAWNVLLNPNHPDAAMLKITNVERVPVDPRLI